MDLVIAGAVLFAAIWVALTLGFGFYVPNFGSCGATYGSLATVIVFLTWYTLRLMVSCLARN